MCVCVCVLLCVCVRVCERARVCVCVTRSQDCALKDFPNSRATSPVHPSQIMEQSWIPCSYCGFAIGSVSRCPCGAAYCDRLCQERHWVVHRAGCQWLGRIRALREVVPAPVAAHIDEFAGRLRLREPVGHLQ